MRKPERLEHVRCFVAVEVGDDLRHRLAEVIEELSSAGADVRWVQPHGLHVTLKFLGSVESSKLQAVYQAVQSAVSGRVAWTIELRDLAAFPSLRRPRVLWIGVQDRGQLRSLAEAVEENLEPLGFARETRPFTPHITLGRVRSLRGWERLEERLKNYTTDSWGETHVDKIVVFRSDLRPDGAVYTPLWTTHLEENRGDV